jgi:hypothetical protein
MLRDTQNPSVPAAVIEFSSRKYLLLEDQLRPDNWYVDHYLSETIAKNS